MIVMEGLMMVPPDRGTIIGRALWKPRYVVLGTGVKLQSQNDLPSQCESRTGSSRKGLKSPSSAVDVTQSQDDGELYISIYKAKGDGEFIAQHPISAFKSCEIRNVQHRKQSASLPTMLLDFKPDKREKRRSSRTPGLTSKDPWVGTLLFRTVPEERYSIYDWQLTVRPQLTADPQKSLQSVDELQSPMNPTFTSFTNPFASRDTRTPTGSMTRPDFQQRSPSNQTVNTYPHAPRERPSAMISPSPSLRSRRSDLSSQGSALQPPMGFTSNPSTAYTTGFPSDLPSPASVFDTPFIEGWTSAQGRSSTLSSHTRRSNSIASAVAAGAAPIGSTPPGPRETILDRAFQMKYIPGSERLQDKDEDKISSIARFEALMREVDERKRQKSTASTPGGGDWGLDEELEESSGDELEEEDDDDADELDISDQDFSIPTPSQRALDYISGRRTPLKTSRPLSPEARSPPIPFLNSQARSAFHNSSFSGGGLRPRAGTSSSQRDSRPSSMVLPIRSVSAATVPSLNGLSSNSKNGNLKTGDGDAKDLKRSSSASVKRLSFTEFAKRLSSTSSLLLVQTNASSSSGKDGSRRASSDYGADEEHNAGPNFASSRGTSASNSVEADAKDKRCGWRGSVGVFGSEGGFL